MTEESFQLDLTSSITDVPQANSLPLFVRLMEEFLRGTTQVDALAEKLEVEPRTVSYYLDFGRWLGFLQIRAGDHVFTETGSAFAHSVPGRGRLFSQAMFRQKLVQAINTLKRDSLDENGVESLSTREAAERAIDAMSDLATSTVERRASGVAHMLEAAYKSSRIDWKTGQPAAAYRHLVLDFPGRTFLTAMAARQFVSSKEVRIGFPRQIVMFVRDHGHRLSASTWQRASYDSSDGKATWFGSVPVNESTVDVAERRGRDLRKLLIHCAPFVGLATALLTWRDAAKRPVVRVTQDMYGVKLWANDREIGSPTAVLQTFAEALDLSVVQGVPKALRHAPDDLVSFGTDDDLLEVLVAAGILKIRDTTFEVMSGLEDELRESEHDASSTIDKLRTLQGVLNETFLK